MSAWKLDYDNGLFLQVTKAEIDSFTLSAFYKISLKRYVGNVEENNGKNFITKGDENKDSDTEPVNINQIVGKVVGKISFIRKIFKFITNKFVIVFFIIFYISYFIYNRNEKNRVK